MISKRLRAMIEQFKQENQKYGTQEGALYQCCDASDKFLKFVMQKDPSLVVELDINLFEFSTKDCIGFHPTIYVSGQNEMGRTRADWHCIVQTKNVLLDFTAKQYVETAPYPLVIVKRYLTIQKIGDGRYFKVLRPAYLPIHKAKCLRSQEIWRQKQKASAAAVGHGG